MVCERFTTENSLIHRTDPRLRLIAGLVTALVVALFQNLHGAAAALLAAILLCALARLDVHALLRRLATANLFFLMIAVSFLFSGQGEAAATMEGIALKPGTAAALLILLKGNAIVLFLTAFLGTVELNRMGYAAQRLGLPTKLVQIFFFAVRYLDELHHELHRLFIAMRARGFRARFDIHTLRTYGFLTGTLLVHSLERSDRILAAMKCRGFNGQFYSLDSLQFTRRDAGVAALTAAGLVCLVLLEVGW